MPVFKRPAMSRRPNAPEAFDIAAWVRGLDIGPEADGIGIVYLGTFSRVLATTLTASPRVRDPSTLQREEIKTGFY